MKRRLLLLAVLVLGWSSSASAAVVSRQGSAFIAAPALAPAAWGTAALRGEWDGMWTFRFYTDLSRLQLGNAFYQLFLRRYLRGAVTFTARPYRLLGRQGALRLYSGRGTAFVAGRQVTMPLRLRIVRGAGGLRFRTFFSVPLAPYGVRSLQGGPPGDVRVSVDALFADGR